MSFGHLLASWSKRNSQRSYAKASLYLVSAAALISLIISLESWPAILACQALLGLVYSHGLELVHECLHHNMFPHPRYNRLFGFLAGIPMLVSYTHYKYQHLHHHRFVGTPEDQELFDYESKSLRNPFIFMARAWNISRIPRFWLTFIRMSRGTYPEVFTTPRQRREVFHEYLAIAAILVTAVLLTVTQTTNVFLLIWFVPWLLFGEAFHFLIELPEHLGKDKTQREIYTNTRSYRCNKLLNYIINGNNYHVEHHLYPRVAVHNLALLNQHLDSRIRHTLPSYWLALAEVVDGNGVSPVNSSVTPVSQQELGP